MSTIFFADFLAQTGQLFTVLDGNHTGKVERVICDAVIKQLQQSIKLSHDSPQG